MTQTDMTEAVATATATAPDVDIKALVRSSKRATATVPICLRGDLVAEFEALDAELAAVAGTVQDSRLNTPAVGRDIAERMAALQEEMRASTVPFVLRALSPRAWANLQNDHPPRKGDDGKVMPEDGLGVNNSTFWSPLVRACVVSPVLDDEDWKILLNDDLVQDALLRGVIVQDTDEDEDTGGGLSNGQFDRLAGAAWRLNQSAVDIPFSRAASAILRSIGLE